MICWIIAALSIGCAMDFVLYRCSYYVRFCPIALSLSFVTCILLLRAFDDPWKIAKGLLFTESLICASICDGISHEIPGWIMLPMLAAGLLEFQPISSIQGFFSVSVLFYLMARVTNGKAFGGGDIKLMASAGWVLGLFGSVGGMLIALTLSLIAYLVYTIIKRKKQYYAMAPWLSIGCFFAYLLIPIGGIL